MCANRWPMIQSNMEPRPLYSPRNNSFKVQTIVYLFIFIFLSELFIFGLKSFILNEAKKDFSFVEKNLKLFQLRWGTKIFTKIDQKVGQKDKRNSYPILLTNFLVQTIGKTLEYAGIKNKKIEKFLDDPLIFNNFKLSWSSWWCSNLFIKRWISINLRKDSNRYFQGLFGYASPGHHIRMYHLIIVWHTLECNIWFWNELH